MLIPSFADGGVVHAADLTFFKNRPRVKAHQIAGGTATSVPDNTFTVLTFDTNAYDNDSIHSTASQTSRFVCNTAGLWTWLFYARFPTGAYTRGAVNPRTNAGGVAGAGTSVLTEPKIPVTYSTPAGADAMSLRVEFQLRMAVGDYLEFFVLQKSGGAVTVQTGPEITGVTGIWESI